MHELIARLRAKSGLLVTDEEQSWELRVLRPNDLAFEISVPRDIMEWFVTVRRASTKQKVWSDWMDYYATHEETETCLRLEMERDIERFIDRLLASTFRLVESRTFDGSTQRLEWHTEEGWEKISL